MEKLFDLVKCGMTEVLPTRFTHGAIKGGTAQAIKIVGTEKKAGGVRLRFLAGDRLLRALGRMVAHESALNKARSSRSNLRFCILGFLLDDLG